MSLKQMKELWQVLEAADLDQKIIKEDIGDLPNGLSREQGEELLEELQEFRSTSLSELARIERLIRKTPYYDSAKAYWLGHIKSALGDPDLHTHATTVERTINMLKDDLDSVDEELEDHVNNTLANHDSSDLNSAF